MNLRKMLVRMLALWLLVSALIAAWAWMNVVLVGTSPWMDAAFGSIVILILTRWTADLAVGIARRSVGRRVGWLYLLLTALTGMLWARLPFLDELANRFLSPLFILRRLIIAVLVAPVLQLRSTYQAGAEMSLPVLAPLALGCLVFGLVALATAIAGRVAWTSIQPILSPGIDAVQTRFPRLMIRPSRWWAGANLLLITTLVLSFVMSGLAIADNANAPIVNWQAVATGPSVPPTVMALALDGRNGTLYAGTDGGGVFRSSDGGASWQTASAGLSNSNVYALALDGQDGTLYAGTNGGGVFRSSDGGASWQTVSAGLSNTTVRVLVLDGRNGTLYAGSDGGGVFRSSDGGASWQAASAELSNSSVLALVLDGQDETLYAGTFGGGVFRSSDGGASWQAASAGLSNSNVYALAQDGRNGMLYAGILGGGVFRSSDGGASWQAASAGLSNSFVRALVLDGQDGTLYAGTYRGGVFRSSDGGASWQAASVGLSNSNVVVLAQDGRDGTLYAGTEGGGVFRSSDGGASWQAASAGLSNSFVRALVLDGQDGTLYAGTYRGGVFRSSDGGASWQAASVGLSNSNVVVLAQDGRDGTLYAGTEGGGVFRSSDGGASWQAASAGLSNSHVYALDGRDGALYAGTNSGGVFRSSDGGASWQAAIAGLSNSPVLALALDGRDGTLYAGTWGGVFRSSDRGASWQAAIAGLSNSPVLALALDGRDGTLYAGILGGGVFRSSDGGASWQAASAGLSNSNVWGLALDGRDGTLYGGTWGGVFRSSDGGASWQAASAGLSNSNVWGLALDGRDGTLYAGTFGGGVFRSSDEGASWQAASAGLSDSNVWALALDEQSGTLYASTDGGIFRSPGGKANWGGANFGLPSNSVRSLAKDEGDGTLYAATDSSTFHSTDGGASWQQVPFTLSLRQVLNSFSTERSYGVVCRGSGNDLVWAAVGGGNWWARLAGSTRLRQATIRRRLPEDNIEVLAAWGNTIGQAQMRSGATFTQVPAQPRYHRIPLAWLAVRALVWKATLWVSTYYRWVLAALGLAIVVLLISTYTNLARPFGIPLWATILARRRLDTYARPDKLDAAWQDWEQAVRAELLHFGDAMTVDLRRVPGPFRQYALRRYAQTYDAIQTLESRSGYVRLLTGDRLRNWFVAWTVAGRAMGKRAGLAPAGSVAVDKLAAAIADALGLTLGPARDFEAVRAYEVEAPALRLNIPPRFPLVFVADPQPSASTVQMLVDAVDVLKETGYFALVVPLESPVRQVDAAAELRQVVDRSAHVQDFIVLSQNDVLDILIARHAAKPLVERVLAQVDLSVVSPFVVSGPVPETMFFGREAEVKTLVEKAGVADYAIIGNRKIGKTSLLKRARTRLAASGQIKPLMVDCQTVRDAAGFFAAFQAQTGIKLLSATPEGFTAVLKDLRQDTPLMLMMDEVDALLTDEQARGEPLAAAWRALAQAGVCRFVFCGSTGLARRLDDPHSVFFNFPQPMPLGYLAPETARLVLTQPLETLGIVLEDEEKLLSEVLALTSGHPNFIQYLGRGLVDAANRRKERRIMLADLVDLRASTDFSEYFLKTVWGEAGPLERLITLVAPPEGFGLKEIETALTAQGLQVSDEQLDTALKLLRIYAILEKHDRTYSFVPRAFPEILHRTQEVERLVAFEKRRLAEGGA